EVWTTSLFLVATPLRPMATPSICITARRIHALPWRPAAFAEFSIGFTKTDKESAKNLTTVLCPLAYLVGTVRRNQVVTHFDFQDLISAFNWRSSSTSLLVCAITFWLSFMSLRDSSISSLNSFWDSSAILNAITSFL